MAKVVNLRRARKSAARHKKRAEADARTGTSDVSRLDVLRRKAEHDGKKLDKDE